MVASVDREAGVVVAAGLTALFVVGGVVVAITAEVVVAIIGVLLASGRPLVLVYRKAALESAKSAKRPKTKRFCIVVLVLDDKGYCGKSEVGV